MEEALEQIGFELGVRPKGIILTIRSLPKAREMDALRARIAGLINDNDGLQAQVADRKWRLEEAKGPAAAAKEGGSGQRRKARSGTALPESSSTPWGSPATW